MRMNIRRLTRLTNAFSKKLESHKAAIALHFAYYNLAEFTGRCGSHLRWNRGSRIMYGIFQNC
jgi:hypothetical protein